MYGRRKYDTFYYRLEPQSPGLELRLRVIVDTQRPLLYIEERGKRDASKLFYYIYKKNLVCSIRLYSFIIVG